MTAPSASTVTGVLSSCGRHDLLKETLRTFFACSRDGIDHVIVVEDGPDIPSAVRGDLPGLPIEWIATGERVGQIAAIDYAYSRVTTPYIFHMEDDWAFYRGGFLAKSLALLEMHPKCLQVQIRSVDDLQAGHPIEPHVYRSGSVEWRRLALDHLSAEGDWHGFGFNPGLRRFSDYVSIGGYGVHAAFDPKVPWLAESRIGKIYRQRDFFVAILSDQDGAGYVRHTGDGRHVEG